MKRLTTVLLGLLYAVEISAQVDPPDFTWALVASGASADSLAGVSVRANGDVYSTGQFQNTAQFGTNSLIANSSGYSDVFVVKCDENGNVIWARQAGGTNEDYGSAVAVNSLGEAFVTGAFRSAATFGGFNANSSGIEDMFLAKYDTTGSVVWLRSAGGNGHDFATALAARGTNGCYVTGVFQSTASFQGTNLTSLDVYDIFLAKYDAAGNLVWVRSAGGGADERSLGLATDDADNAIITGYFASATVNFGGVILTNQNAPYPDGFLVKYDAAGNVAWAGRIGGSDAERGVALAANAAGELYVTGSFASPTITLGSITLTNRGGADLFLAKYGSNGNLLWARSAGGTDGDLPASLAIDAADNSYIAGSFGGVAEFGGVSLTNSGFVTLDAFAVKYDDTGNLLWAVSAGGSGDDSASGIGVDAAGHAYLGGSFESAILSFGASSLTNRGGADVFISQIELVNPELSLVRSGPDVVLTWPDWHNGFALQSAAGMDAVWSPVTNIPVRFGNQFQVTAPVSGPNHFYRLFHP